MRYLIVLCAALVLVPASQAKLRTGVAAADVATYSVTVSKTLEAGTLIYEERVLYGGVDVGGFSLTFSPHPGIPLKAFSKVIVRNVRTASLLDQGVDILYGGEVIAHATFKSTPPVAPDPVHGLECQAWSDRAGDLPMDFSCDILAAA